MTPRGLTRSPGPISNTFPAHMAEEEVIFTEASFYDQDVYGYQDQTTYIYMYPYEFEYEQHCEPNIECKEECDLEPDKKDPEMVKETLAIEDSSKNL